MELQERAAQLAKYLVTNNTPGERQGIVVKADDAPEWVADVVRAVHGDTFPDDWTYKAIKEAADAIEEEGEEAEVEADIYTSDLLKWLADFPGALDMCDEATSDYGQRDSLIESIRQGQYYAYRTIVQETITALQDVEEEGCVLCSALLTPADRAENLGDMCAVCRDNREYETRLFA